MEATRPIESVSAGIIRCFIAFQKVSHSPANIASIVYIFVTLGGALNWVDSRPDNGKMSNFPAKTNWNIKPVQNTGIPTPRKEKNITIELTTGDFPVPVITPNGVPINTAIIIANAVNSRVAG